MQLYRELIKLTRATLTYLHHTSLRLAGYSTGLGGGGQDAFVVSLGAPSWDRPNPAFLREVAVP